MFSHRCPLLGMGTSDPTWHSAKEGEIFQTDGILTRKRYYTDEWSESFHEAYTLVLL